MLVLTTSMMTRRIASCLGMTWCAREVQPVNEWRQDSRIGEEDTRYSAVPHLLLVLAWVDLRVADAHHRRAASLCRVALLGA